MPKGRSEDRREITAVRVNQWLEEWSKVPFNSKEHRRKPKPWFYLFALSAADLKALSGIQRRTTAGGIQRSLDLGIQRRHDEPRSEEIQRYIKLGYPLSVLTTGKSKIDDVSSLRKPGWLPTAIVVNILGPDDTRRGAKVVRKDLIEITDRGNSSAIITLPEGFSGSGWLPEALNPLEVIDGQHRLWAFEKQPRDGAFELPVVAFHGLDISWQAYLFWTINIKPVRINASLAYDLYPLLRTEDWLEKAESILVYRETRAQELSNTA